jgi:1-acyl-sn-glycerol-3-phosphate acyltransferase
MRLNPISVLKEHESAAGAEAGVDPLPLSAGTPLEPLYKAYSLAVAWPVSLGLMSASFATSIPLSLFVPFEKTMPWLPQPLMGLVPQLVTLFNCSLTYHPDFDPSRVSLFVMNHTSILDAHVALWAIPHAFCGIQHAHHFKVPVYGWLMKKGNGIGVTKGEQGQAQMVAEQVDDRARRGISILGFPEGRRTQNGRILPYRRGLFLMARNSGLPVVPIAVRGLWGILRRGEWVVRPNTKLEVYVGPQLETRGLDDDQVQTLAERCQAFTADFVERGVLGDASRLRVSARGRSL